jgi:glycosyltransferase involved in cell wall biosynthesis
MRRWLHRRAFLKGVLEAADAVICPSRTIRDLLGNAAVAGKWRIIRNGIAADWFAGPRPGGGGVKSPADLAVGFAGAMAPHKGPHLLIEALRLLGWDRTQARLAGPENDPAYAERLRRSAVGLNAEFPGCLSAAQMKRFLRGLDVLAVTSVWLENCPYVVLEAQAAGAVVVGPDRGGVAELIADPALRYPMGSARGLADALEYARTHPSVSSATGVPTEEQMADATLAVYQAVADETGGRPNP